MNQERLWFWQPYGHNEYRATFRGGLYVSIRGRGSRAKKTKIWLTHSIFGKTDFGSMEWRDLEGAIDDAERLALHYAYNLLPSLRYATPRRVLPRPT